MYFFHFFHRVEEIYFLIFSNMIHTLPTLPYSLDDLTPYISRETLEFHYGKHHQTYVDNLNKLIVGTPHEDQSLEEIIRSSTGGIFNNAAQIWNHTFYFEALTSPANMPESLPSPGESALYDALTAKWGGGMEFIAEFNKAALANFGSGWTWLMKRSDGSLDIVSTPNAQTPLTDTSMAPLLTCDVWEHAYYIDYRNARAKYLENFWHVLDWKKVEARYVG
jgi:superoxide dismutase, Fe-Mn family